MSGCGLDAARRGVGAARPRSAPDAPEKRPTFQAFPAAMTTASASVGTGGGGALASLLAGAWLAAAGAAPAFAQPPSSLREALFGDRPPGFAVPAPPVARYRLELGESFVLDRQGRDQALIRFEGGAEVWALTGVPGPHGDMIFKNDVGEPMLRATRFGGVTLFTASSPQGAPAMLEGGAVALRAAQPIGPQALFAVLAASSVRASRAVGRAVSFDADLPEAAARFDWLFADAAQIAAEAFARSAAEGRRALAGRFSTVRFLPGRRADVAAEKGTVRITVATDKGVAGRPSSRRILMLLTRR